MGTVIFNGVVSKQAGGGETVTINILALDGTLLTTVSSVTDDGGSFAGTWAGSAGSYKANAQIGEDDLYLAANSGDVAFVIPVPPKQPRTITLNIDSIIP